MEDRAPTLKIALEKLLENVSKWRAKKRYFSEPVPKEVWSLACEAVRVGMDAEEVSRLSGLSLKKILRKLDGMEEEWTDIAWKQERIESERRKTLLDQDEDPQMKHMRQLVKEMIVDSDSSYLCGLQNGQYELFNKPWVQREEELLREVKERIGQVWEEKE